jgi:hypothetical protein
VAIRGEVLGGRSAGRVLLATLTIVSVTVVSAGMMPVAVARAECPNEQLRREQVYGSRLPDCRAYEQVSPTQKNLTDAAGEPGIVQASSSGSGVSFFAVAPFPGTAGSGGQAPTYLSVRSPDDEWLTAGLLPEAAPGSDEQVVGLTEDLAETILFAEEPPLAPGAELGVRNAYVFDNAGNSYQLLASNIGFGKLSFADAMPNGSRILFETKTQLAKNAAAGVYNLYEWNEAKPPGERVSLAGVLPDGKAPTGGSVAGPGGLAVKTLDGLKPGGSTSEFYTQNTISEDGARIFFTEAFTETEPGKGIIYMRESEADRTVQVSAGTAPAYWRAATPSGSFAFYTEGEDLYRYDVAAEQREALTSGVAGVQGTLGVSEDGSYAYFVATGKLASDSNGNGEAAESGADNLYEWHEETATHTVVTTFIARLLRSNAGEKRDESDWRDYAEVTSEGNGPSGGEKSSRVAPDGKTVLFSSVSQLTSYDNSGEIELYLYDAEQPLSLGNPLCVSCNPNGDPAVSGARLTSSRLDLTASPNPRNAFLTRNLSSDGSRVFFQTEEALVPGDENNQLDVYEWEREGAGSCERASASYSASNGGCLYLISTGQSDSPSYFGDASESGDDVFFFTRQSLVSQDQDLNVDVYDARVEGGIPAQNPSPPPAPCTSETSCRTSPDPPPAFDPPTSTTLTGEANLKPPPPAKSKKPVVKCPKHKKRTDGRCVKKKKKTKRMSKKLRAK